MQVLRLGHEDDQHATSPSSSNTDRDVRARHRIADPPGGAPVTWVRQVVRGPQPVL